MCVWYILDWIINMSHWCNLNIIKSQIMSLLVYDETIQEYVCPKQYEYKWNKMKHDSLNGLG